MDLHLRLPSAAHSPRDYTAVCLSSEFHNLPLDLCGVHLIKKCTVTCHKNAKESYYFVWNQIWNPSLEGAPTQFMPIGLMSPSPSPSTRAFAKLGHILGVLPLSICQVISPPSSKQLTRSHLLNTAFQNCLEKVWELPLHHLVWASAT